MRSIQLTAPDGTEIVGMLAQDGSTFSFECKHLFRGGEHHFFYELPADKLGTAAELDGDVVLVDSEGKHWAGADVQHASTPKHL